MTYRMRLAVVVCWIPALVSLEGCNSSSGVASVGPDRNGEVLSSEPIQLFVTPGVPVPGMSYKISYRSTNGRGRPVTVTGTVTTPLIPWNGPGERPIVALSVGTRGVGDRCAPSNLMAQGTDYEAAVLPGLLTLGYGVAITDYMGVGTDEVSTYVNRLDEGHAVLDSIRAAQQLPEANLPDAGPVATFGYSQGGEGSGAALELQASYAPELNLIAGYAGAIPSDERATIDHIDGGFYTILLGFFLNGLNDAFPANHLLDELNDAGKAFAAVTTDQCLPLDGVYHPFIQSSTLFKDGRTFGEHLGDAKWEGPMSAQHLGGVRPSVPALILQSIADDIVPESSTIETAHGWCALGATVQYNVIPIPTHVFAIPGAHAEAALWLSDRFAGKPATTNCGAF